MFRGIVFVFLALLVAAPLNAAAQSQGGSVTDPPRQGPPPAPKLDESSNLVQEFSTWRSDLQAFFDKNASGKSYAVAYGIGTLDSDELSMDLIA